MSSQVPNTPSSQGDNLYVDTTVSQETTQLTSSTSGQSRVVADTISKGEIVSSPASNLRGGPSSLQYQQTIQAAIDSFLYSLIAGNLGNSKIGSDILKNILNTPLPSQDQILSQYSSDYALLLQAQSLVADYNNYMNKQYSDLSDVQNFTDGSIFDALNRVTSTNFAGETIAEQIADLMADYQKNYQKAQNATNQTDQTRYYNLASNDLQQAMALYDTKVSTPFSTAQDAASSFNQALSQEATKNVLDPNYTEDQWNSVQAALAARNSDPALTQFFGTLINLPDFVPTTSLATSLPTDDSVLSSYDLGLPMDVDASTDNASILAGFQAMIDGANQATTVLTQLNNASSANDANFSSPPTGFNKIQPPNRGEYIGAVNQRVNAFTSSTTFTSLLSALGLSNDAAAQALAALLLSEMQGMASVVLTNPGGGAITGATLSTASNSALLEAYAQAMQQIILRKVRGGQSYIAPMGMPEKSVKPAPGLTGGATANKTVTNPSVDKSTTASTGSSDASAEAEAATSAPLTDQTTLLNHTSTAANLISTLVGSVSIAAAAEMLNNSDKLAQATAVSTPENDTLQTEFLSAVSALASKISPTDLDQQLTALMQAQGENPTSDQLAELNSAMQLFLATLQGNIVNIISGQKDLAVSTIGAEVASQFVQSTFQDVQTTQQTAQEQLANQQTNEQYNQDARVSERLVGRNFEAFQTSEEPLQQTSREPSTPLQPNVLQSSATTNQQNNQTTASNNQKQPQDTANPSTAAAQAAIQSLLAQLPQTAYLVSPAFLAKTALATNGSGPNGNLGLALSAVLPKDANGDYDSVTPSQLYSNLSAIQGPQNALPTFLQMLQNEPSYQLEQIQAQAGTGGHHGHAGQLMQQLQNTQQTTLADNANQAFTQSLYQANTEAVQQNISSQEVLNLISNPTLSSYLLRNLLPGQTLLNKGMAIRTDMGLNTPSARNTTEFPV